MKIHPTAIISKDARLDGSVEVGAYTIINGQVRIESNAKIGSFCVIEGNTSIGSGCQIFTGAVIGSIPQDLKYKSKKSYLIIGDNNIIREYVTINPGTEEESKTIIGNDNLLMAYSHVAHDCKVGNGCIIANNGTLAGYVTIEDKSTIGGLVAIHQFVRVGELSIVGGCSKVVQDIPPYSTCDGHPTKVYGLNLVGLKRAGFQTKLITELKRAFKILFNSGLTISHALEKIKIDIPNSPELSHLVEFVKSSQRGVCR